MKRLLVTTVILAFAISGCLTGEDLPDDTTKGKESESEEENEVEAQGEEAQDPVQEEQFAWTAGECTGFSQFGLTKGVNHDQTGLSEASQGLPFEIEFALDDPWQQVSVYFWGSDWVGQGESSTSETKLEGTVPEDATGVVVTSCGGMNAQATFTVLAG